MPNDEDVKVLEIERKEIGEIIEREVFRFNVLSAHLLTRLRANKEAYSRMMANGTNDRSSLTTAMAIADTHVRTPQGVGTLEVGETQTDSGTPTTRPNMRFSETAQRGELPLKKRLKRTGEDYWPKFANRVVTSSRKRPRMSEDDYCDHTPETHKPLFTDGYLENDEGSVESVGPSDREIKNDHDNTFSNPEEQDDADWDPDSQSTTSPPPVQTPERKPKGRSPMVRAKGNKFQQSWDRLFERLKKYHQEVGDAFVPQKWPTDRELGKWASNQRYHFKKGNLSRERYTRLATLGFWAPRRPRQKKPAYT